MKQEMFLTSGEELLDQRDGCLQTSRMSSAYSIIEEMTKIVLILFFKFKNR